ncbi:MAG: glycosyltransferase family 4 protein [Chloroflexi bacterium]|nr:glycosyltransferase family 4 protein [Chloroflexota bacterium]
MTSTKRIAILHDALVVTAGSEKVALHLSNVFPDAPLYTSAYLPENTFPEFKGRRIITLPFASLAKSERQFKGLFPLWYIGFSRLDLSAYDLVISSANYLAKFINPPPHTRHICYLHNPFRFLWKRNAYSDLSLPYGKLALRAIDLLLPFLRKVDVSKTRKIDHIVANSRNISNQIKRIYGMESDVIYPPVPVRQFLTASDTGDYYLYAGRLISHKRVDIAIKAFNQLNRRLIIAGDGLERPALEKLAGSTITFTGRVSDQQLKQLYARCKALIFPSDEDFGLIPVEVQASGRPVIAYQAGGALETVVESETGLFFPEQTAESLCEAVLKFERMKFNPERIRENALRFDESVFEEKIRQLVDQFN